MVKTTVNIPIVKRIYLISRAYCMVLALCLFAPGLLYAAPKTPIFVLHSYSQEYPWTRGQHEGFIQTLAEDAQVNAIVSTEYLDTKRRAYDKAYASELARHLRMKYNGYKPAAIYVTDDNALLFARDHLSRVFPNTLVFFSGINDYGVRRSLDSSLFTGVYERQEIAPNLEWLLRMDKNANDLIFIGDGSNTYHAIENEARSDLIPYRLRATFIAEKRLDRALSRLHDLPGKYLFLTTLGGMTDANGQVLPLRDTLKSLALAGRIVISMEDSNIMEGVLGGYVTSGQKHGMNAARLLLAYLHGKPIADLPPLLKSPNALIFDDRVLQKYGINLPESLRAQAVLLNPRPGFYQQNRSLILTSLISLASLLFLVVTVSLVIMSRKKRELSLARKSVESANALFNQLAEQSMTIHWEINADGLYTYVSPVSYLVLGYRPEELVGVMHFYDLYPESQREASKTVALEVLARKESFKNFESDMQAKNGRIVRIATSGIPLLNTDGSLRWYQGSATDITDRKQAEDALKESNSKWEAILSASPDGIGIASIDGKLQYMSNKLATMYGYSVEQKDKFLGKTIFEFIDPTNHEMLIDNMSKLLAGKTDTRISEYLAIGKDNSRFYVDLKSKVLFDASGKPASILFVERDITERKQTEQALLETNRQLQEAIDKAEMANMAKSEFLANMSHELRTPMNGVIGMNSLLLDTELNDDQRRYAETVRVSGESLLALLNDILDFSKIEAKKLDLEIMDFDLRVLLDDFAAVQALRAHEKGLEFICSAAPDVPSFLRGDPGRLRQILVNLAGNAVKFTHQGEIAVRASLLLATDSDVIVRFSIKDTGIGIPADKQNMLFQKFTQVDASVTRKFGGTGLGLAISKQLSEMMGGEVGLNSPSTPLRAGEAGKGTEFWFTARFEKQAQMARIATPLEDISGMRILVVDDNATNRDVLLTQLASWGVVACEAADGLEALAALHTAKDAGNPFVGAILDMQMPGMNGVELAVTIKADDTIQDTRLILMTSMTQRGDAKRVEEIGFAAYLTKPARQSDLYSCLAVVLSGKSMPQAPKSLVTRHTIREMRPSGERILLAEDNIINQQVAIGILEKLGLHAEAVANGNEAVEALKIIPYDLVLMDCMMPEMDGYEATRVIRNPRSAVLNHKIPIIAMTANAIQGDRDKCLKAGMNDYVSKPIDAKTLAAALEKWLPKEGRKDEYPMSNTQYTTDDVGRVVYPLGQTSRGDENKSLDIGHSKLPIFDLAGMMDRLMGDKALVLMLIGGFLDDIPKQIDALRSFVAAGDVKNTERQAHTIKGASANMGGEGLRAVAFEMEKEAKAGNLKYVKAHLPDLKKQFERLKKEMKKYINK